MDLHQLETARKKLHSMLLWLFSDCIKEGFEDKALAVIRYSELLKIQEEKYAKRIW